MAAEQPADIPRWHGYVYTIGRVLRSWCISLGCAFLAYVFCYSIGGDMPARFVIALVLGVGTVMTLPVHDTWGQSS